MKYSSPCALASTISMLDELVLASAHGEEYLILFSACRLCELVEPFRAVQHSDGWLGTWNSLRAEWERRVVVRRQQLAWRPVPVQHP